MLAVYSIANISKWNPDLLGYIISGINIPLSMPGVNTGNNNVHVTTITTIICIFIHYRYGSMKYNKIIMIIIMGTN